MGNKIEHMTTGSSSFASYLNWLMDSKEIQSFVKMTEY